jgi:hypothetical protein
MRSLCYPPLTRAAQRQLQKDRRWQPSDGFSLLSSPGIRIPDRPNLTLPGRIVLRRLVHSRRGQRIIIGTFEQIVQLTPAHTHIAAIEQRKRHRILQQTCQRHGGDDREIPDHAIQGSTGS